MKRMIMTLTTLITLTVSAYAMSYSQAREQALFLTDKMAYELNLNDAQYEAAYEINLDYLMAIDNQRDLYGDYWRRRNLDLSYVLFDWQYRAFCAASYFYRPLYWDGGYWHFAIYARYPHRNYFYFGRPNFIFVYNGGHSWHHNGHRSWYCGRDFGHRTAVSHKPAGMRDRFDRGDYGNGYRHESDRNDGNRNHGNRNHGNRYDNNRNDGNRYDNNRNNGNRYDDNRNQAIGHRNNGSAGNNRNQAFGGRTDNNSETRSSTRETVRDQVRNTVRTHESLSIPARRFSRDNNASSNSYGSSSNNASSSSFGSRSNNSNTFTRSAGSSNSAASSRGSIRSQINSVRTSTRTVNSSSSKSSNQVRGGSFGNGSHR